jgi:ribulose-phosphate 3-epimerase
VVAAARPHTTLPFEAHLMVVEPDALVESMVESGCELVIVHAEACVHLHRTLSAIRDRGARSGVAVNPATPLAVVEYVLDIVDLLLVMTVNPGFGGQSYLAGMEPKIAAARRLIERSDQPIELEVDGGIGPATIAGAARAGADVFCAGSALYRHPGGLAAAVTELRECAEEAWR